MKNINIILILALTLQGCLPIIFTAATTGGVNAAKDQPISQTINDSRISTAIRSALFKDNFKELGIKIKVEVSQGRVLYTGEIAKEEDALRAVEIAWNQRDVKEVINELKVSEKSSNFNLTQYTKDSIITGQIKAKSLVNREIRFSNYTVITINHIVYLFGIARSEEELEKISAIASKVKGVEKVVYYVKILDNANNDNNEI
jgi:osmotically-inducible protein OsmY